MLFQSSAPLPLSLSWILVLTGNTEVPVVSLLTFSYMPSDMHFSTKV